METIAQAATNLLQELKTMPETERQTLMTDNPGALALYQELRRCPRPYTTLTPAPEEPKPDLRPSELILAEVARDSAIRTEQVARERWDKFYVIYIEAQANFCEGDNPDLLNDAKSVSDEAERELNHAYRERVRATQRLIQVSGRLEFEARLEAGRASGEARDRKEAAERKQREEALETEAAKTRPKRRSLRGMIFAERW